MIPSNITYHVPVARWEPNTRERLVRAALELFAEQGYDATTVSEIARRAGGLSKMTFFRHFTDKREVLFAGQDTTSQLLADAIDAVPGPVTPLQAVAAGLDAIAGLHPNNRREFAVRLLAVIVGNPELRERAAFKRIALTEALTAALEKRGVPGLTAGLAADLGIRAYYRGYQQWAGSPGEQTLTDFARQSLGELLAASAALDLAVTAHHASVACWQA
jgi:AcrR family transcriptional regulator